MDILLLLLSIWYYQRFFIQFVGIHFYIGMKTCNTSCDKIVYLQNDRFTRPL